MTKAAIQVCQFVLQYVVISESHFVSQPGFFCGKRRIPYLFHLM
jgi:hypothetical protein